MGWRSQAFSFLPFFSKCDVAHDGQTIQFTRHVSLYGIKCLCLSSWCFGSNELVFQLMFLQFYCDKDASYHFLPWFSQGLLHLFYVHHWDSEHASFLAGHSYAVPSYVGGGVVLFFCFYRWLWDHQTTSDKSSLTSQKLSMMSHKAGACMTLPLNTSTCVPLFNLNSMN